MSGFVIGVRLMCDIKFISELLLRVMMFLSELEQIFRKLNIANAVPPCIKSIVM